MTAHAAAARRPVGVGALPRRESEGGVAPGFALDRFERVANARPQGLEPVAGGLLLFVEGEHAAAMN